MATPGTDYIRGIGLVLRGTLSRGETKPTYSVGGRRATGVWGEPVLMSPGYREVLVPHAIQMNKDQLLGKRIPNLKELGDKEKTAV